MSKKNGSQCYKIHIESIFFEIVKDIHIIKNEESKNNNKKNA
jgi:hypothetical protein